MIALNSLWTSDINEIEKFLKYTLPKSTKEFFNNKLIKVATHHVNESIDEETIVICYCNPENQNFKYNQRVVFRIKGSDKVFPLWKYDEVNYCMLSGGIEI